MPLPKPKKDEKEDDFMHRCMGDENVQKDFGKGSDQCVAVCSQKWRDRHKEGGMESVAEPVIRMRGEDVAEVLLYDTIGTDLLFQGITAQVFRAGIKSVRAKTINLRINSPGGSVTEAAAMLATLDQWKGSASGRCIEVDVDGIAASAASFIAMAGDTVRIASNGLMMIHDPMAGVQGGSAEMRRTADLLDKVKEQILDAYGRKSKAGREQLAAWMAAETWFAGQEAVDAGLADGVSGPVRAAAMAGHTVLLAKLGYHHAPPVLTTAAWQETESRKQRLAVLMMTGAGTLPRTYSPDQERDERGRFGSGGGGSTEKGDKGGKSAEKGGKKESAKKEPAKKESTKKGGKSAEHAAAEKKVEKAKAALQKAKDGLAKANKELKDVKTKEKDMKAAARGAAGKAKDAKPVDASKQIRETVALHNRYADRSVKVEDINRHVEDLGKTSNKQQVLAVAREIGIQAKTSLSTKDKALDAIRLKMIGRKGAWARPDA